MDNVPVLSDRELAEVGVQEEAQEIGQELCKARRFGWLGVNPYDKTTPAERIAAEIGDFLGALDFFLETHPEVAAHGITINLHRRTKKGKLLYWNGVENRARKIGE